MKRFSIVVPVYQNELNLPDTIPRLLKFQEKLPNYELELVWLLGIFLLPNYLMIDILTSGFIAFKNFKIFNFFQISQFGLTLIAIIIASNLGIKNGATIVVLTMLICSIPFHVFKSFLNKKLSKGFMEEDTKKFFKKQNITKLPQILLNSDLIIFLIRSGTVSSEK